MAQVCLKPAPYKLDFDCQMGLAGWICDHLWSLNLLTGQVGTLGQILLDLVELRNSISVVFPFWLKKKKKTSALSLVFHVFPLRDERICVHENLLMNPHLML